MAEKNKLDKLNLIFNRMAIVNMFLFFFRKLKHNYILSIKDMRKKILFFFSWFLLIFEEVKDRSCKIF